MPLSDPIDLEDEEAKKFMEDLEHPVHSEARAAMLEKAAEAAVLLTPKKQHRGPDKQPRKKRIPKQIMRLNRVVHKALEPDVREALLSELHECHPDIENIEALGDSVKMALLLAKWMRQSYMKWLPEVPICPICGKPMEQGIYMKESARTFKPNPASWTSYDAVDADLDSLCGKIERYVCMTCFEVECVSRENDVRIIIHTRKGRCGEHAILYGSFLTALGIQTRLIAAILDGDDHVWQEVLVNGTWIPIDVSAQDPERLIKDPQLFAKWGWKLERVYAIEAGKLPVLVDTYRKVQVPEIPSSTHADSRA